MIMPIFRTTKAIPSGGSLRITIPATWVKSAHVEAGTELQLLDHGVLIIFPPKVSNNLDIDSLTRDIKTTLTNFIKK